LIQAIRIGLSQDAFWRMTPRELYRELAAAKERHSDEVELLTLAGYQAVRIWVMTQNKKKMPEFASLLPKKPADRKQTKEKLKSVLHMLAAQYGGRVRTRKSTR